MLSINQGKKEPDILDVISDLSNEEVFTPPWVVNSMLDLLPEQIWRDKELRWIDPFSKTAVFLREVTKRLLEGLKDEIPNDQERLSHILHKMVFGVAITELTSLMSRRTLYCSKDASGRTSVVKFGRSEGNILFPEVDHSFFKGRCSECKGSKKLLDRAEGRERYSYPILHSEARKKIGEEIGLKFDVVVGNPPYQMKSGGEGTNSPPIYDLFVSQAIKLDPKYVLMIIPSRWTTGGMNLGNFRKEMLEGGHLSTIVDFSRMDSVFPNEVDSEGGVQYFLWDRDHKGLTEVTYVTPDERFGPLTRKLDEFDVLVRDPRALSIIRKVLAKTDSFLTDEVSGVSPFGFPTNFRNYNPERRKNTDYVLHLYVNSRRDSRYIDASLVSKGKAQADSWKVMLPEAYGERGAYPAMVLGPSKILGPGEVCTHTYLTVGTLPSEAAAQSLNAYLKTKFVRFLVGVRKNTQHTNKSHFNWVPHPKTLMDLTDAALYQEFSLDPIEIAHIEESIREMA
jgi:site-specific DNA-methyltransferase (adenine-specific)